HHQAFASDQSERRSQDRKRAGPHRRERQRPRLYSRRPGRRGRAARHGIDRDSRASSHARRLAYHRLRAWTRNDGVDQGFGAEAKVRIKIMMNEITVLIADDHPIFCQGLRQIIASDRGMKILAEAEDGERALELIKSLAPRVAVLDVDMPSKDGFDVAREVR